VQTNGTSVYGKISTVVDNGDGTVTVTFTSGIVTGTPAVISWLEQVRFESGELPRRVAAGYEFEYAGARSRRPGVIDPRRPGSEPERMP
jgi:hypothetical protein